MKDKSFTPLDCTCAKAHRWERNMGLNGIGGATSPANLNAAQGNGAAVQVKALEQKLQQLSKNKEKAQKAGDEEKTRELEQQIQEIRTQIEQLKRKETAKTKEQDQPEMEAKRTEAKAVGRYVDESL